MCVPPSLFCAPRFSDPVNGRRCHSRTTCARARRAGGRAGSGALDWRRREPRESGSRPAAGANGPPQKAASSASTCPSQIMSSSFLPHDSPHALNTTDPLQTQTETSLRRRASVVSNPSTGPSFATCPFRAIAPPLSARLAVRPARASNPTSAGTTVFVYIPSDLRGVLLALAAARARTIARLCSFRKFSSRIR